MPDENVAANPKANDGNLNLLVQQLAADVNNLRSQTREPRSILDWIVRFSASGFFFMVVGTTFIAVAFRTIGQTHSAMSFVFVVVGVAILLYGTGTQGIGQFDSGEDAAKVARYKVALAGGAGVLAFCVAAGIIRFAPEIKSAFQIEQRYLRFQIKGKGYHQPDDIGRYVPDVKINGNSVPAMRRGDYIEVYAPYIQPSDSARFEIRAKLRIAETAGALRDMAEQAFIVELDNDGTIVEEGDKTAKRKYNSDSGYDFPWFRLNKLIELGNIENAQVGGVVPR